MALSARARQTLIYEYGFRSLSWKEAYPKSQVTYIEDSYKVACVYCGKRYDGNQLSRMYNHVHIHHPSEAARLFAEVMARIGMHLGEISRDEIRNAQIDFVE